MNGHQTPTEPRNTLAALSCTAQTIYFYDIRTFEKTATLDGLVAEPHELLYHSKRDLLYVSHTYRGGMYGAHEGYSKEISVVNRDRKVIEIIDVSPSLGPHDMAIDESRNIMWVSVEEIEKGQNGGLVAIDLNSHSILKKIPCEAKVHWFVMTLNGCKAYTANKQHPFISILDLKEGKMTGKIAVPYGCEEPDISQDGSLAYFPTPGLRFGNTPDMNQVEIIDTATDIICRTIPLSSGYGAECVRVTPQGDIMIGQYRFGPRQASGKPTILPGRLSLYDSKGMKLIGEVELGKLPLTMRTSEDGSLGFIANVQEGTVSVIDLKSMTVRKVLDVDTVPSAANKNLATVHGLALIP